LGVRDLKTFPCILASAPAREAESLDYEAWNAPARRSRREAGERD